MIDDLIGKSLAKYNIIEEIGRGGMATVYRARDTRTGAIVALKIMYPHLATDPTYIERFRREAKTALSLDSPHIVKVLDYGSVGGRYFLTMEYVTGKTLQQLIKERGSLAVSRALDIARQVVEALKAAHQKGIVHRDIKPQNIMVTPQGVAKVMDFGIAKMAGFATLTQSGAFLGSPHYIAPEQAKGRKADIHADIYALGVVLYQMLVGIVPFDAETPWGIVQQHIEKEPVPTTSHRADIPLQVDALVRKALAKDPASRYQTPREMLRALESLGGKGEEVKEELATMVGYGMPTEVAPRPRRRFPIWALAGGGVGTILLLVTIAFFALGEGPAKSGGVPLVPTATFTAASTLSPPNTPTRAAAPSPIASRSLAPTATPIPPTPTPIPPTPTATTTSAPTPTPQPQPSALSLGTIAFAAGLGDGLDICTINSDGSNFKRLTSVSGDDRHPAISPDRKWIAFESNRDENIEIYLMKSDGSAQTNLTRHSASDYQPAFSPDGRSIVFISDRGGHGEIWVVNVDGSNQRRLVEMPDWSFAPAYSPDGSKIVFVSMRDHNQEIYVMGSDGSNQMRLTDNSIVDEKPSFSADGNLIAYHSGEGNEREIWVMRVDGNSKRPLTDNSVDDWQPTFSWNGNWIAFSSTDGSSPPHIYIMRSDGSQLHRLTWLDASTPGELDPAWAR